MIAKKSTDSCTAIVDELKPKKLGVRHVQALLMFLGLVFGYFLRVNISAAIVPMTTINDDLKNDKNSEDNGVFFDWGTKEKSLILSSFFWGYVLAQVPAGLLAKRFGGKIVLVVATVLASIVTILHPWAAKIGGWQLLCGLRVFIGLTQGVLYPAIHTLLAKWAPRTERSVLATCVYSGAQFGTALILATSGSIFSSNMGWSGIFYISGGLGLIWSLGFFIFGADSPKTSKSISAEEQQYIELLTGSGSGNESLPIPWKALFTSLPFYGLIAAHCGFTWGFYTLLTEIPTYMSKVLQFDVKANALLSALPYLAMGVICLCICPLSDMVINRNYLSVTASRKLFNTIGQWLPMVCLIALGYMTETERFAAIILLTLGVGFNAASFCGYLVNHMDLSPNFAGPMMGITNGLSNLLSIFAPLVVGAIVDDESNPAEWRIIFFITAGFYLCCNSLFIAFGKGTIQSWNEPQETDTARNSSLGAEEA